MAKLSNVRNLGVSVVSVHAEKIAYDSAEYVKTAEEAKPGDIIRINDDEGCEYITDSAYYLVDRVDTYGDAHITDNDGDDFDTSDLDETFEVFAKVSAEIPQAPVSYREVERSASVGERVKVVNTICSFGDYAVGDEFTVIKEKDSGGGVNVDAGQDNGWPNGIYLSAAEYVVLEPVSADVAKPTVAHAQPLPDKLPESYEILDGEVYAKEQRQAAEGDRILIVKAQIPLGYKNGDILTVKKATSGGIIADNAAESGLFHSEYVVLTPVTSVSLNGKEYALESRVADAEEAVLITRTTPEYWAFKVGEIGVCGGESGWVAKDAHLNFADGRDYFVGPSASNSEYLVLVPQESAKPSEQPSAKPSYAIGDYVKVTDASGDGNAVVGDIAKVTFADHDFAKTETADGRKIAMFAHRFTSATAEEIAAYDKAAAIKQVEESKWSAIGRKVGEFKAGDIAEFAEPQANGYNALTKGDIGTVSEPNHLGWVRLNTAKVSCGNWCEPKELRLIAPVARSALALCAGFRRNGR
jgi:hypothetical protein